MTQVRWTDQAVGDLKAIREFIERDSLQYGRLVAERLFDATERLEAFPLSGRVVPELERDDWYTPPIKKHTLEKISLHNEYAALFNRAMKNKWPQRAYIGLYSGGGRARIDPTGEIVETTAMSVFRLSDPFTHHIFVDSDPRWIEALRGRIPRS